MAIARPATWNTKALDSDQRILMKLASRIEACSRPMPEIGRQLRQMARILVHALIGVDADRAGIRQPKGASRRHPVLHEVVRQTFAQLELQRLDRTSAARR